MAKEFAKLSGTLWADGPPAAMPETEIPTPKLDSNLHVVVTREPFMDFYNLTLDDGTTEELELEECKQWFKERGANMDKLDKVMDHVWNFYRAEINIVNPKEQPRPKLAHAPKV
jgi:hypothetical protein